MEFSGPRLRPATGGREMACRKHPKHGQSPGVCSVCLMEKLAQLSANRGSGSNTTTMASSCSSSSLSPLSSSSEVSSYSSPTRCHFPSGDGNALMMKSRSVAFITRRRQRQRERGSWADDEGKRKAGFWSKLLRRKKKRVNEGFTHSKTTRERVAMV